MTTVTVEDLLKLLVTMPPECLWALVILAAFALAGFAIFAVLKIAGGRS
jgi:hypothetical protein